MPRPHRFRVHTGAAGGALFAACMATGAAAQTAAPAPLSIDECLAVALERSPTLRDARLALDISNSQVTEAWGNLFPTVEASATITRNLTADETLIPAIFIDPAASPDALVPVRFSGDNLWNMRVTLDQPLFEAQAFVGVGAAGRYKALQVENVRGRAQAVVTTVRLAYYSALLARENVRSTEESVRRVRQTLDETQALQRAGFASDYDVLRLEVELGNLEPNLQRARNAAAAAERELRLAMGLEAEAPLAIAGSLRDVDFTTPDANDAANAALLRTAGTVATDDADAARLLDTAARQRSELRRARLDAELAQAQLAAERATLFPTLSAFANYSLNAQENGGLDFFGESADQRTSNWQAGLRLELPIFRGGQDWSRVSQRRLALERSRTSTRDLEERAASDVRTRLADLLEARERVGAQRRALGQARRGFEIAAAEYRQGTGSQLQVTDAEVALRSSEFNYSQAVHDVLQAQAALDAAVGIVPLVDEIGAQP